MTQAPTPASPAPASVLAAEPPLQRAVPAASPSGSEPGVAHAVPGSPYAARPWLRQLSAAQLAPVTPPPSVLHAFKDAVARAPRRTALAYFDGRIDYSEADALSDSLAGYLAARGVRRGDRVAVMLQNTPQFVLAALAAWKTGAVVVPLNPMYKAAEAAHILRDSGAAALVCEERAWTAYLGGCARDAGIRVTLTTRDQDLQTRDDPRVFPEPAAPAPTAAPAPAPAAPRPAASPAPGSRAAASPAPAPRPVVAPGGGGAEAVDLVAVARQGHPAPGDPRLTAADTALISYTSGTSGPPKGAMNPHGALTYNAVRQVTGHPLPEGAGYFALAPLFHITGLVCELTACLVNAGTLVLAHRFHPGAVLDAFLEHRPAYAIGPATAFTALAAHPAATPEHFASFQVLSSGGAPLPPALVERLRASFGFYLRNGYGLTECTAPCASVPFHLEAPVDPASGTLSVGVPGAQTLVRILDEHGAELPLGETGEIAVRGPQVVPGYWRRPEESAEAFPDGELRTGDVGFMDAEGWLYVVDRKKDMIIASGFKVWPREVEDVLYTHPAVREAAVVGVPDPYRGESVKAYVSLRPGARAEPAELSAYCAGRLAAYKYPREVEILPVLPQTTSGKILRRELRDRAAENCRTVVQPMTGEG
ncbi:AMP-binding protein [Streptomyces sp. NBC_00249]|uniref:class I adenylate-forming enzyme family protein n=1 Tax=Streptomyces sp. NBC_00249 TaxID=2975690 RepID=UPI002257D0B4|nr:AMP-binding protein [Streptomyces sp. NBC_00249]MCX5197671.1 AMP-binding protein [Streptomyces sp. NBC_00249]